MMRQLAVSMSMCLFACLGLTSLAQAQSAITGTVRDPSGAVLPGVTVEAASPVLIEKVKSAVTDAAGQYRIVDLRPGTYSVTFTLSGFTTLRRDEIELPANFTASLNARLAHRRDRGERDRQRRVARRGRAEHRAALESFP